MSVYKDPRSSFYTFEFWLAGHRHRGSTQKRSKREAQAVERELKERALAELRASIAPASTLTLADGCARYVQETQAGQEIERQLARSLSFLGPDTRMVDLNGDDIAKLVSWLRGQRKWGRDDMPYISAATVNRTGVELLRRVFTRARKSMGSEIPA